MRMWNVPTQYLCRKHLLGEHVEMHMFVGTWNAGKSLNGYVNRGLVEVHNIDKRHDELAKEMLKRGMQHKSPLPPMDFGIADASYVDQMGQVDIQKSMEELSRRCEDCKARIAKTDN